MNLPFDNLGIVVNYFWKESFPESFHLSTLVSLTCLLEAGLRENVVLVDGSPVPDPFIRSQCERMGIACLQSQNNLNFADGYNLGIKHLKSEYIGLMANDIFPSRDVFIKLFDWVSRPDVGCAFPYLSTGDYPGQIAAFVSKPLTCEPTFMTLNLNLFKRSVLEEIGGLDRDFSGGYNDVDLLVKIRKLGYRVVLVGDTNAIHLGRMTISQGSNYKISARDHDLFVKKYPALAAKHGKWGYKHWVKPFAVNKRIAFLWWLCQHTPSTRLRNRFERELIRHEAEFARCAELKTK